MPKIRREGMENWHWCNTYPNYLDMLAKKFVDNLADIFVGLFKFIFGLIKIPIMLMGFLKEFPFRILADVFKWGYYKKLSSFTGKGKQ